MGVKTLLVGLDGATFDILDPLMEQGVMPFLREFVRRGVRAPLRTVVPPLTPPAWTSVLTGRTPGHHGVFDFFQLEAPGARQVRLVTSHDVRCATLATMVNAHGMRASVLNFPVHYPPPPIDGYVIAGWMPWRQLRLGCHPQDLLDRLKTIPGFNPRELAMDMSLEARATEGCPEDEYEAWAELHIRRDEQWRAVLQELISTDPTELVAVLLDGPDKIQHVCWRFLDPVLWPESPSAEEVRVREACLSYFRHLDEVLRSLVELAGPEATTIIVSDHGFGATVEVFHVNTWLAEHGYLAWSDEATGGSAEGILGLNQLTRHVRWIDWDRTRAFAATPTSNGIHLTVSGAEREALRSELIDALYAYRDPRSGEPVVSRVWTREEAFPGDAGPWAPDLTLELRDGGLVSILPSDEVLIPRPEPAGTHRPIGVLMAAGPGIRSGMRFEELSVLDVAPLTLYSLDLPVPEDLEGRVPLELYSPGFRARRRPRSAAPMSRAVDWSTTEPDEAYDQEAEAIMLARLRDLGYIE